MENLAQILRGLAPGQIDEAVQLLQRYKTEQQVHDEREPIVPEQTQPHVRGQQKSGAKEHSDAVSAAADEKEEHKAKEEREEEAEREEEEDNCTNRVSCDEQDEEDIPLALLYARLRCPSESSAAAKKDETAKSAPACGANHLTPPQPELLCRGEHKKAENGAAAKHSAVRGLASFGFVSATRRSGGSDSDKNRLITPFVQDKRIVPRALRFWRAAETPPPSPPPPQLSFSPQQQPQLSFSPQQQPQLSFSSRGAAVAVDESSSSLLHPPVVCADGEVQRAPERERFANFADMIDAATAQAQAEKNTNINANTNANTNINTDANANAKPSDRACSCPFHVRLPAPRAGFCDEVIFCGFYAIGYDPCQSRPPYFGTHNSRDTLNSAELLRLARFPRGAALPRVCALVYEYNYDSGDDWDIVDGDEDIGASSSGDDDEEDDANASLCESELDFINDGENGENENESEEDEDAELQRRMMEARQRRVQRLRQKEKLLPAFSGPFVGVAPFDHPLRAFDKFERFAPALFGGEKFSAALEAALLSFGRAATHTITHTHTHTNTSASCANEQETHETQLQQRFVEAALRNRREMTPGEVDAVHALVAANARLTPRAIINALREQQWCTGVARAEIMRTIRRFYESQHKRLVRRAEPWDATDERLFAKAAKRAAAGKDAKDSEEHKGGGEEDKDEEDKDKDEGRSASDSGDETLVVHALRKRQREAEEATGTPAAIVTNE